MDVKFQQALKNNGYSLTATRVSVFNSLNNLDSPITMSELINNLSETVDRATIYRTIEVFEKTGVVSRVQIGWKYKLELSDLFSSHHHHITCSVCGKTTSFHESEKLEYLLTEIAESNSFVLQKHTLELSGLCNQCK